MGEAGGYGGKALVTLPPAQIMKQPPHQIYLARLGMSLNQFHPQSPGIIEFFGSHIKTLGLTKGDLLLEAGHPCNHYYFIVKGALRGFIRNGKKDVTTWISVENEMVTSISSLDMNTPALENMQAIEDSVLLLMHNDDINRLYNLYPEFNITGRKLLQQYYRDAEARAYISRLTDAMTKYKYFLSRYGHLSNRIQLKYISSFLGMTIETLSRVRKKLSVRKD